MASDDHVVAFNVRVEEEGLQGRSKLEKAMQAWFGGEGQRTRFVLWGPGGTGKSTLALKFAAAQVEREGAACSSVRLVFALSRGSMAQDYTGLLGKSCVRAGHSGGERRECVILHWHFLLTLWPADKLQCNSTGGVSLAHEEARQRVHQVLLVPGWSGRWLGCWTTCLRLRSWRRPGLGGWRWSLPGSTGGQSSRREQGSGCRTRRTGGR